MNGFQSLPNLWLLSDERNDAVLEARLDDFREQVGFVYRHYHLPPAERLARFDMLATIARRAGHLVILSDSTLTAREWGADGVYGAPLSIYPTRADMIAVATVHDMREMAQANRLGADAVMLSPVFPTRSHPGGKVLGPARFRTLANHARMPVIALGGMTSASARRLGWLRWAAIDGLS
ncbi:thiamine phosphate synthase [Aurantiacibacter zhengii]|uniref:Thiamine phosphate synthase n=1 Tax=Aurantiacibacter zhengii TaxID=2307003 RepID=A0A418NP34_9SPHN|nr:thiamine phosphate synthase [Aurantiacibacter zhengii]RIV83872.1 thiamine phosphate synthase [Aurantiacibacter zhengii]